ncbi:hypothetical protein ASD89_01280 [Caulobacter sp. Root656]|nr:hypothetical protein ASD89_01280 [Caulobacter sp. Root656]
MSPWLGVAAALAANPIGISPSAAAVPENLLRIELAFDHADVAPDAVVARLLDEDGAVIDDALLDLALPGADGRHLTLLMHPGRVKTDVGPNSALGRALKAGRRVTLVVSSPGSPIPSRRTWQVVEPDVTGPSPGSWRATPPVAGGRASLRVALDAPLDAGGANLIAVRNARGERIAGAARFEQGETVWAFTPTHPWATGAYDTVVHPNLEDPAGNRTCGAFEAIRASLVTCQMVHGPSFVIVKNTGRGARP